MQSPDEIQVKSLSVLKKFALLIELACCVSRLGACGGLWTEQMLLVCSTYLSVMCMYCVLFDLRRKLKVTKSSERMRHSQPSSRYYGRIKLKYGTMNCTKTNSEHYHDYEYYYASFHQ